MWPHTLSTGLAANWNVKFAVLICRLIAVQRQIRVFECLPASVQLHHEQHEHVPKAMKKKSSLAIGTSQNSKCDINVSATYQRGMRHGTVLMPKVLVAAMQSRLLPCGMMRRYHLQACQDVKLAETHNAHLLVSVRTQASRQLQITSIASSAACTH